MMRQLLAWFVMLLLAVANGTLRDFTYGQHVPELYAHQLSTLSGSVLLGAVMWGYVRFWPPGSARHALYIGLFWMALTVAFELLFFHYVAGHPWEKLLANYNLLRGRLWVLLLAWVAFAPLLFYRLRQRMQGEN